MSALIGPNGAGKTTCFNLLTKFLAIFVGCVLLFRCGIVGELAHWLRIRL